MEALYIIVALIVGFIVGAVVLFLVMKNNPKYFNLKAIVTKLISMTKTDLAALKAEIDKILGIK